MTSFVNGYFCFDGRNQSSNLFPNSYFIVDGRTQTKKAFNQLKKCYRKGERNAKTHKCKTHQMAYFYALGAIS